MYFRVTVFSKAVNMWNEFQSDDVGSRTGSVRELGMSSHPKFKHIWHQFNTVQFPRRGLFGVQFGSRHLGQVPPFSSVHSAQFTNSSGLDSY